MAYKNNNKYLFSYGKKKQSKVKQNIGTIINRNGDVKSDPKDMAEIINDKYETSWSTPKETLVDAVTMFSDNDSSKENTRENINDGTQEDIDFGIEDVKDAMWDLSETSASGPY